MKSERKKGMDKYFEEEEGEENSSGSGEGKKITITQEGR